MFRFARTAFVSFLIASAVASAARADGAAQPGGGVLTMEAALARAEELSPLVRRARAERQAVAAREVGASQLFPSNPVISGGAGPRRESQQGLQDLKGIQFFGHIEQTIEIGAQRSARRKVVSQALHTAELREQVARAETRARVRAAYVGVQLALARVEAAAEREALVTKLLDAVRARVAGGASSNVDLELARLERGTAARARVDATLSAADAAARLRLVLAMPPGQVIGLSPGAIPPPTRTQNLGDLLVRARSQRAELAALASGREEIDLDIVRLKREAIPSPTLFVDVQQDLPGQVYVGGGLALPLPILAPQPGRSGAGARRAGASRGGADAGRSRRHARGRAGFSVRGGAARDVGADEPRGAARRRVGGDADDRGLARREVRPVPPAADVTRRRRSPAPVPGDIGSAVGFLHRPRSGRGGAMTASDETVDKIEEKKKMSKTTVVLIATVALGVVGVLVSRGRASSGDESKAHQAAAPVSAPADNKQLALAPGARAKNPVKVAAAEMTKLAGDIQVVGTVAFHEDHYAVVGPLVTGRISKLIGGVGDKVKRGQVIAEIESSEVGQARADYVSAKARAGAAEANLRRETELNERRSRRSASAKWRTRRR